MYPQRMFPLAALALLLLSAATQAAELVSPPALCGEGEGCVPEMVRIEREFQGLNSPPNRNVFPTAFSGECYYLGFQTDPAVKQYGVALLEGREGSYTFNGQLNFFYDSNPYLGLSPEQVSAMLIKGGSKPQPVALGESFAEADYPSSNGMIRYWLRQDPIDHSARMLGLWVLTSPRTGAPTVSKVFCSFMPNR